MDIKEIKHSTQINAPFRNVHKTATGILLLVNGLLFVITIIFQTYGIDLADIGGLHFFLAKDFHLYQFLSYLFLHANLRHIISNLLFLWIFGLIVEKAWGPKKFVVYYMICGIVGGIIQEIAQLGQFYMTISAEDPSVAFGEFFSIGHQLSEQLNAWTTIGSSGAVGAVILAFGLLFSEKQIYSIKVKWLIISYVIIDVLSLICSFGNGGVFAAQLGAMICGFIMMKCWKSDKEPTDSDDKMTEWGMKLLLVAVGIKVVYLAMYF